MRCGKRCAQEVCARGLRKRCAQEVCARGLRIGRVRLPTSLTRTFHVEHPSVAFALGMNPPTLTRARVSIRCSSKAADRDPKRPSTKLDTGDLPAGRPHDVARYEDRCPSIGRASSQSWRKARQVPMALGWRTAPAPFTGLASSQTLDPPLASPARQRAQLWRHWIVGTEDSVRTMRTKSPEHPGGLRTHDLPMVERPRTFHVEQWLLPSSRRASLTASCRGHADAETNWQIDRKDGQRRRRGRR
jgi:hypothetical protein